MKNQNRDKNSPLIWLLSEHSIKSIVRKFNFACAACAASLPIHRSCWACAIQNDVTLSICGSTPDFVQQNNEYIHTCSAFLNDKIKKKSSGLSLICKGCRFGSVRTTRHFAFARAFTLPGRRIFYSMPFDYTEAPREWQNSMIRIARTLLLPRREV